MTDKDTLQGEGNRDAARRYNQSARDFTESDEGQRARDNVGQDEDNEDLENAARRAATRARDIDPAVSRDYSTPSRDLPGKDRA